MNYTVFYGQQVYFESDHWVEIYKGIRDFPDGVYILDSRSSRYNSIDSGWYLKDLTPVLIEDVPVELRMMQLLLNL